MTYDLQVISEYVGWSFHDLLERAGRLADWQPAGKLHRGRQLTRVGWASLSGARLRVAANRNARGPRVLGQDLRGARPRLAGSSTGTQPLVSSRSTLALIFSNSLLKTRVRVPVAEAQRPAAHDRGQRRD